MALSSALFAGISGLSTLGNAMQVIGDNISNVNTVGFKNATYQFQDLLSQSMATQAGTSQVGKGVTLSDIYQNFQQGSFETTSNTTDLAIGGDGFFIVREPNSDSEFLTRAGNFRFDRDGYLVNPEGYVVRGYAIDDNGDITTEEDIMLDSFQSAPEPTDEVRFILNLDESESPAAPGAALEAGWLPWDGSAWEDSPLADNNYLFQTSTTVYDDYGESKAVTLYFDKTGDNTWEYITTCSPQADERAVALANPECAGLLGRGTLTFDPDSAKISDMTMDVFTGAGADPTDLDANDNYNLGIAVNPDGYLAFDAEFNSGQTQSIALDLGSYNSGGTWVTESMTTTQYSKSFSTVFQSANGYGAGDLQGVNVDVDGVITGIYSNGQVTPLYRVALATVVNKMGLEKVGGNLFKETRLSGVATPHPPGENGTGNIAPNSLEQSNVDIANEFVKMITTQRGFQANGKIITVTDQMLAELINLKR